MFLVMARSTELQNYSAAEVGQVWPQSPFLPVLRSLGEGGSPSLSPVVSRVEPLSPSLSLSLVSNATLRRDGIDDKLVTVELMLPKKEPVFRQEFAQHKRNLP